MFEWLIIKKEKVKITCGTHSLVGTISNYYKAFQLVKMDNVLIPIECIKEIEVLSESPDVQPVYKSKKPALVKISR